MKRNIIHIGLPKTGTTWLQNKVFPHLKGYVSVGRPHNPVPQNLRHKICFGDPTTATLAASELKLQIEKRAGGKNYIFSDEMFTAPDMKIADQYRLSEIMQRTFPEARIFISIREQKKTIESVYNSWPTSSWWAIGLSFFVSKRLKLSRRISRLPFGEWSDALLSYPHSTWASMLNYDKLLQIWAEAYGKEPAIIPIELLWKKRTTGLEKFSQLASCSAPEIGKILSKAASEKTRSGKMKSMNYSGLGKLLVKLQIRYNKSSFAKKETTLFGKTARRFFRFSKNKLLPRFRKKTEWTNETARKIESCYAEPNTKLSRTIGIELAEMAYPTIQSKTNSVKK